MPIFPKYHGPSLMEQATSYENLTQAYRRVRSNIQLHRRGRSAGVDAVTLRDFEADWSNQMAQLADELQNGVYRPLPAKRVSIPKPDGGQRSIAILAIRDRVAQRAFQQVLDPVFDPLFHDCSYGCRPYVGVPDALARVVRYADQGLTWVVDADITRYYDTIDQRILLGLLRQRIDELPVLRLIAHWLAAGALATPAAEPGARRLLMLEQGRAAAARLVEWSGQALQPQPAPLPDDPYSVAVWDTPGARPGMGVDPWARPYAQPPLEQRLWSALALAQPVLAGARRALPLLRQVGGTQLLAAGAVTAGVLAAGELALRRQPGARRGTMQGGALSPLLANVYLHPFDTALTAQGLKLVRFVDDFVIMCASRQDAERALELARRQLATLHLELHPEKTGIVDYHEGLAFLGQALVPRRRGPRLTAELASFEQAEQVLRDTAARVRRSWRRGDNHSSKEKKSDR